MKKAIFIVLVACAALLSLVSGVPVARRDDDVSDPEFVVGDALDQAKVGFFGGNGRGDVFRPAESTEDDDSDDEETDPESPVGVVHNGNKQWFGGNGRGMAFRRRDLQDTDNSDQVVSQVDDNYFGGSRPATY